MSHPSFLPAVILAQGTSRRFAAPHRIDKGLALLGGEPLVAHVAARLRPQSDPLAVNAPETYRAAASEFGATLLDDAPWSGSGPLAGIRAALAWAREVAPPAAHVLVAPVDMPFLPLDLAARLRAGLGDSEAAIACTDDGSSIPVLGLWPLAALPVVEDLLREGNNLAVRAALDRVAWRGVPFARGDLDDLNDPASLLEAEARLSAAGAGATPIPARCDSSGRR